MLRSELMLEVYNTEYKTQKFSDRRDEGAGQCSQICCEPRQLQISKLGNRGLRTCHVVHSINTEILRDAVNKD